MTLDLSQADHNLLDEFLNTILDEYRDGNLTQLQARSVIAEAVALAAKDNGNVTIYMRGMVETRGKGT